MFTTKNYMLGTVALGLVAFAVGCGGADAGQNSESTDSDEAAITALAINPAGCAGSLGTATGLFSIVANNNYINNIAIDTSSLQDATFQLSTVNNFNQTSTVNQQATIASNSMQSLINQYTNFTNAAQTLASQTAQQYAQQTGTQYVNQVVSNQTNQVGQHYGATSADHFGSGTNVNSANQFASGAQSSNQFANNNFANSAFANNGAGLSSFAWGGGSVCGIAYGCGGPALGANTFTNAVTSNTAFGNNNTAAAQNTFFNNGSSQFASNAFNNATHAAQTNSQVDVISATNVDVLTKATATNALTSSATTNIANTAAFNSGSNASSAAQSSTSTTQQQTWAFQNLSNLQSNHMLLQVNMTALSQHTKSLVNIFANTASNALSSSQFAVQTPVCW